MKEDTAYVVVSITSCFDFLTVSRSTSPNSVQALSTCPCNQVVLYPQPRAKYATPHSLYLSRSFRIYFTHYQLHLELGHISKMPSIDEAMARSLRGSAWEVVKDKFVRTIVADLSRRDMLADAAQTTDEVAQKSEDFATAFSSWDNCMNVAWCKWPVIGVMIIGGLIIFSIVWCIIRCCCCGLSCCCSCCQCLKCCGNCCGACDPPRSATKHLDDPYAPQSQHHGYRSEPPMNSSAPQYGVTKPMRSEPPQYAEFETSKGRDDDALPEMPSWEGASSKKVEVHTEAFELDTLPSKPPS
uniref:Fibroin-3 n=1 Tax=Fusarium oxysporum (strain Fo5176) TaxID=660025 RepID=A0A0D2XCW1_FUSOF